MASRLKPTVLKPTVRSLLCGEHARRAIVHDMR